MTVTNWQTCHIRDNRRTIDQLIMFPSFAQAYKQLQGIDMREPGSLCYVIGPGGSGKTTLREALPRALFGDRATWPVDQIPIISVSADTLDRGYFNQIALGKQMLAELMDPFHSIDLDLSDLDSGLRCDLKRAQSDLGRYRLTGINVWEILKSLGKQVKLRHILVDEANLLVLTQAKRIPSDYVESLRTAAINIGCTVVLFGTFELLKIMDFSAQSNRRSLYIQLERLLCRTSEEQENFLAVLDGIAADQGIPLELLDGKASWVYDVTYGIPGEMVELLERAKLLANGDQSVVTWGHLERASHLPQALARMRFEADEIDRAFCREYAVTPLLPIPALQVRGNDRQARPNDRKRNPVGTGV